MLGVSRLCQKTLAELSLLMTHNAYSSAEDSFIAPNHYGSMNRSLHAGVRGLHAGRLPGGRHRQAVPRRSCGLGQMSLLHGLTTLAEFLQNNQNEVVVIMLEDYLPDHSYLEADMGQRARGVCLCSWQPHHHE